MTTLYISEFANIGAVGPNYVPILGQPAIADQTIAIGAASVASNAFNAKTNIVLLSSDTACCIKFGTTPTAATTNFRLPANVTLPFTVIPGSKVAVIAAA